MVSQTYTPPVNKLLAYADCSESQELLNYLEEFGFAREHVPELIRMATDKELHDADPDSHEAQAPLHACRTLGQLRSTEAIEPLITLFEEVYADWSYCDLPKVFGLIGEPAIPALTNYLADDSRENYQRFAAASSLTSIAENYPDVRNKCVSVQLLS
jgi:HEAT repeat protein